MKKRLFTIVLAIAMFSSMLALPAAATEVEPRYAVIDCEHCGVYYQIKTRNTQRTTIFIEAACQYPNGSMTHSHEYRIYEEYIDCETCGEGLVSTFAKVYCGKNYVRTTGNLYP